MTTAPFPACDSEGFFFSAEDASLDIAPADQRALRVNGGKAPYEYWFPGDAAVLKMQFEGDLVDDALGAAVTAAYPPNDFVAGKFGDYAVRLPNATHNELIVPYNAGFDFATNDFTFSFWCKPYHATSRRGGIWHTPNAYYRLNIEFNLNAVDNINLWTSSTGSSWNMSAADYTYQDGFGAISMTKYAWNHVAIVRSGTNLMSFINGVKDIDFTHAGSIFAHTGITWIGRWSTLYPNVDLDDFVLMMGAAQWTANFTPPTEPLVTSGGKLKTISQGGGFYLSTGDTSEQEVIVYADADVALGTSITLTVEDDCGNQITVPCFVCSEIPCSSTPPCVPTHYQLAVDTTQQVCVQGGCPPFRWVPDDNTISYDREYTNASCNLVTTGGAGVFVAEVETTVTDRDGQIIKFKVSPSETPCDDCDGTIGYTSQQMVTSEEQVLTVEGETDSSDCYTWQVSSGSLDVYSGNSVTLTAPSSNPSCANNILVQLLCNCVVVDSLQIAVTSSLHDGSFTGYIDFIEMTEAFDPYGQCQARADGTWWDLVYWCGACCSGTPETYSCVPTAPTLIDVAAFRSYSCTDVQFCGLPTNWGICTLNEAYSHPCSEIWVYLPPGGQAYGRHDQRTASQIAEGCCPAGLL